MPYGDFLHKASGKLAAWINRTFSGQSVEAEHILSELSEDVQTIVDTKLLLKIVAQRITETLQVPRIAMLLGQNGAFAPAYTVGYSSSIGARFPEDSMTVSELKKGRVPLRVCFEDKKSWVNRQGFDAAERSRLEELGAQLLLPLSMKARLLGFISLGPRLSDESYTGADLKVLQSVAVQTGLVLENSELATAVAREAAERERLKRELEIAREVHQYLFPRSQPRVPGADCAGTCRPAQSVGGDYYDFVSLGFSGQFGIAIGDVSGKGIPAALMMASLQASLRGQTIACMGDLAALMGKVNRLIFDASPPNRYATLFYSQYDPSTRRLTYVNAGHNAPMLLRGDEVIRLDAGGPVVGLFQPTVYEQATLELKPRDVLVAYTDGISEAMNGGSEEWGEERLIAAARQCRPLPAAEMLRHIMGCADAFAARAPQNDDMTIVVMKVL